MDSRFLTIDLMKTRPSYIWRLPGREAFYFLKTVFFFLGRFMDVTLNFSFLPEHQIEAEQSTGSLKQSFGEVGKLMFI